MVLISYCGKLQCRLIINIWSEGIGYKKPKIKVFIQNQIISFIQKYPSIILSLKNYNGPIFTYNAWEKTQDMIKPKTFIEDEKRKKVIEEIRNKLRERNNFIARIKGLSGVGKTRLVLEALSSDDLKSKVVYFPRPEDFRRSNLLNRITYENDLEAIIVVDDCYVRDHDDLLMFKNRGDGALITISDDMV